MRKLKKMKKWPLVLVGIGAVLALNYNETMVDGKKTITFDKWYHKFMDDDQEMSDIAETEEDIEFSDEAEMVEDLEEVTL